MENPVLCAGSRAAVAYDVGGRSLFVLRGTSETADLSASFRQTRFQQQFDEKNPHPSPVLERRGFPHFRTNTCCLFPFLEKTLLQFLIPCTFFHNSEPPDSFLLRPESSAMYSIVKEQEIVMAIYYHIFYKSQLN